MAVPPDPTFGAGFDAERFRSSILNTMVMGLPNASVERPTFRWKKKQTFSGKLDPSGRPYRLDTAVVDDNTNPDVQVPCAVSIVQRAGDGTPIGEFENPRAVITLLDEEYEQVRGCSEVLLGEDVYTIKYTEPPVGLFTVTVYTIHAIAVSES